MKIPIRSHAAVTTPSALFTATVRDDGHKHDQASFNSLIGIVTAICGNILISVALNTQRYAHIKLNEHHAERRRLLKRAERRREASGRQRVQAQRAKENPNIKNIPEHSVARNEQSEESFLDAGDEQQPLLRAYQSTDIQPIQESDDEEKTDELSQKTYLKSPYWWAGITLMTIGEAGNFLAYGFAPASIVSPLGVVAIISNCIIAPFFMKEPFRWRDLAGVFIAVAGAVTVVLSASENNPKLGPHEIWELIATWEFETYFGITMAVIICLMLASNKYGHKSIFIDLGLVGLFGAYTVLSTKGVASLLSYTLFQALMFPVTYLLVAILVGTAVMQIKYVNRALQRFDATQVIPTQFVLFTLSVILGSAVLYRDFERTATDDAGKFFGGCALTFIGVWLITTARPPPAEDDEEFDEDEEAIVLRPGEEYHDDVHAHIHEPEVTLSNTPPETFDDADGRRQSLSGHRSEVSLPESLERNHWESGVNTPRQPTLYGTLDLPNAEASSIDENPWQSRHEANFKPKSSLSRFLEPLSSLFPLQTQEAIPPDLAARHSSPNLPLASDSTTPLPRTSRTTSQDTSLSTTPRSSHPLANVAHPEHRHSLATIYPAPFTSPLSSSLSAMVAESLRRGVDIRRIRRRRPTRPRIPNMPGSSLSGLGGHSDSRNDAYDPLPQSAGAGPSSYSEISGHRSIRRTRSHDVDAEASASGRRRSLSNRLGDFLRRARLPPRQSSENVGTTPSSDDNPAV